MEEIERVFDRELEKDFGTDKTYKSANLKEEAVKKEKSSDKKKKKKSDEEGETQEEFENWDEGEIVDEGESSDEGEYNLDIEYPNYDAEYEQGDREYEDFQDLNNSDNPSSASTSSGASGSAAGMPAAAAVAFVAALVIATGITGMKVDANKLDLHGTSLDYQIHVSMEYTPEEGVESINWTDTDTGLTLVAENSQESVSIPLVTGGGAAEVVVTPKTTQVASTGNEANDAQIQEALSSAQKKSATQTSSLTDANTASQLSNEAGSSVALTSDTQGATTSAQATSPPSSNTTSEQSSATTSEKEIITYDIDITFKGTMEGLMENHPYRVSVKGFDKEGNEQTYYTKDLKTAEKTTEIRGFNGKCTCKTNGCYTFSIDYTDENNYYSDFSYELISSKGEVVKSAQIASLKGDIVIPEVDKLEGKDFTLKINFTSKDPQDTGDKNSSSQTKKASTASGNNNKTGDAQGGTGMDITRNNGRVTITQTIEL